MSSSSSISGEDVSEPNQISWTNPYSKKIEDCFSPTKFTESCNSYLTPSRHNKSNYLELLKPIRRLTSYTPLIDLEELRNQVFKKQMEDQIRHKFMNNMRSIYFENLRKLNLSPEPQRQKLTQPTFIDMLSNACDMVKVYTNFSNEN